MYVRKRRTLRRPKRTIRRRKYSTMSRTTYKKTARIVKRVLNTQTETKRLNQTFNAVNFAANNSTTSTDGHVITTISIPSVGTAQNQRIGNRIRWTGMVFNYCVQLAANANVNYPLTGRILFLMNKEGGTSFPIGNFYDNDPNKGSITYNSIRNPDFYKDFVVLRTQRIRLGMDNYQSNYPQMSSSLKWKGNVPVCINSNVPTTNSLFLLFVADAGYVNASINPSNYFALQGEARMYFKDD